MRFKDLGSSVCLDGFGWMNASCGNVGWEHKFGGVHSVHCLVGSFISVLSLLCVGLRLHLLMDSHMRICT